MNTKERFKNDVLITMRYYLDANTLSILTETLNKQLVGVDIVEIETLPATIDNTNQYIKELFMLRKAPKLSKATVNYYLNTVDEFISVINKPLVDVSESDIEYYLLLKKKNNSNTSLNNLKRNLSAFFSWMRKIKLIRDNPCEAIDSFTEIKKPVEHLSAKQMDQLKKGCKHKRDRALLEFFRCTAMRRGELPLVKVNEVDFRTGKITIYGRKGKKYRNVFIDELAITFIKDYLDERGVDINSSEPLFTQIRTKKELSEEGIYSAIKAIARRSGIKCRVYPHLFRKTTATNIVKRGGSIEVAGQYLGHAKKTVTERNYIGDEEIKIESIFRNYIEAV